MEQIKKGNTPETVQPLVERESEEDVQLTGSEAKIAMTLEQEGGAPLVQVSSIVRSAHIPTPPFWGTKVVDSIPLEDVFSFINEAALFRGQWRITRGKRSEAEYKAIIEEKIRPDFEALKAKAKAEGLLQPKVVYGYFPCQSDGNDLHIYDPSTISNPQSTINNSNSPWLSFSFPRQAKDRHLCISDFFASRESGRMDVVAFHMVTMGAVASEHAKQLYDANEYRDYLYFHGLSVESAEALAELWHRRIRTELGIHGKDAPDIKRLFSQGYQGARFSFGYPACPNLEDHRKLFELIRPERIGVTMTEEYMLNPEQSTDAIIVHHPEARYFNIQ